MGDDARHRRRHAAEPLHLSPSDDRRRHQEREMEEDIIYYDDDDRNGPSRSARADDGVDGGKVGGGGTTTTSGGGGGKKKKLLRWTFSQSQASPSKFSQDQPARSPNSHPTSFNSAGANFSTAATMSMLSRNERRRRRHNRDETCSNDDFDDDDDDDDNGDETNDEGEVASFDGSGGGNDNDNANDDLNDSEDPFASLQSYVDGKGGEDGRKESPYNKEPAKNRFSQQLSDEESFKTHEEKTEGIGSIEQNPNKDTATIPPNQHSQSFHNQPLAYDEFDFSDGNDDGEDDKRVGIDMKELRRESFKRKKQQAEWRDDAGSSAATAHTAVASSKRKKSSLLMTQDDLMADLTNSSGNEVLKEARKAAKPTRQSKGSTSTRSGSAKRTRDSSVGVKKAKSSIVGSRPMHWGKATMASGTKRPNNKALASSVKKLSDATKRKPMDRRAATAKVSRNKNDYASDGKSYIPDSGTATDGRPAAHLPAKTMFTPKAKISSSAPESSGSAGWEKDPGLREMGFLPPFIGKSAEDSAHLAIQDDPNELSARQGLSPVRFNLPNDYEDQAGYNVASSIAATPGRLSAKHSRRSSSKLGTLTKTLRDIRSASQGDCMRLKSGANSRDVTKRRRTTDVSDPRNRASTTMDVTLLGDSIHWEGGIKRATIMGYVHSEPKTFAWICLDHDTLNEQKVVRGTQLRIYNPMIICSTQVTNYMPSTIPIVTCTSICEVYPKDLPPLSPLPVIDELFIGS